MLDFEARDDRLRNEFGDLTRNTSIRDIQDEDTLARYVIANSKVKLRFAPLLFLYEWQARTDKLMESRRGDLVFTDGRGLFVVCEVKYLNYKSTGRTAVTKRRAAKRRVEQQARAYARLFYLKYREEIECMHTIWPAILTNGMQATQDPEVQFLKHRRVVRPGAPPPPPLPTVTLWQPPERAAASDEGDGHDCDQLEMAEDDGWWQQAVGASNSKDACVNGQAARPGARDAAPAPILQLGSSGVSHGQASRATGPAPGPALEPLIRAGGNLLPYCPSPPPGTTLMAGMAPDPPLAVLSMVGSSACGAVQACMLPHCPGPRSGNALMGGVAPEPPLAFLTKVGGHERVAVQTCMRTDAGSNGAAAR